MSYEEDVSIDQHDLENEWVRQSSLYLKYAELSAQATLERDKAKEQLDLAQAELDTLIRKNPTAYGIEKVVEALVKSTIVQQEDYKIAYAAFLEVKETDAVLSGVLKALEHKKKALEKLSELWMAGYYSDPNISKEAKQQTERVNRKRQNEGLKRPLKRRTK